MIHGSKPGQHTNLRILDMTGLGLPLILDKETVTWLPSWNPHRMTST